MTHQMKPPQAMSLFDLIGRAWDVGDRVERLCFNATDSAVAALCADGRIAFMPVKDSEHPEKRMRLELETGRMTIRPREGAIAPPEGAEGPVAHPSTDLCAFGEQGFAYVGMDGCEIWRATARGQSLRLIGAQGDVTALGAAPGQDWIVVARGRCVTVYATHGGAVLDETDLVHDVTHLSVSPDGLRVACFGIEGSTVLSLDGLEPMLSRTDGGPVIATAWSPEGRWLVAGCRDKALIIIDLEAGRSDRVVDFPAPVGGVAFSKPAAALIASGAFRTVGWRLPDLPFGDHPGAPIETGRPGLTVIESIAAHPLRDLCAVVYANGLITICRIGHRDEMMLREGTGKAVSALGWSADGMHLAFGTEDGTAAIVAFPKNMFK